MEPKRLTKAFAEEGLKNTIPEVATEDTPTNAATYAKGFPSVTMTPIAVGGQPPSGKDMNGILYELSSHIAYMNKGGQYKFDADFCEEVGGYDVGAVVQSDDDLTLYVNQTPKNKTNPNSRSSSGWKIIASGAMLEDVDKKPQVIPSIAKLRQYTGTAEVVIVQAYKENSAIGGGVFIADKTNKTASDNGGTVILANGGTRWFRQYSVATPAFFGAVGDGKTDDTGAFTALENAISHSTVDLEGKTYKTTKDFSKNHYVNGIITTGRNQDYSKGKVLTAQSLLGNGGSSLIGMVKTVPDQRSGRAARSILQGAAQDPRTGEFWTIQPYSDVSDGAGGTVEASVLVKYAPELWGTDKEVEPVLTSKPSADIGHQTCAVQYKDGNRYLWVTGGNLKKNKRQLYAVRLQVDDKTGEITDTTYFQLYADGVFNGDGNNCVSVSPDGQWLACTSKYTDSNIWVCRVWRMNDLIKGNNTDTWSYEFPIRSHNLPVQAIALDGNFVYVLHGGDATKNSVYSVFSIDGAHIADYINDTTGKDKMAELEGKGYNKYFEPEAFAICNFGGQLVLTQWISLGKKNDHHTCVVYAMRPMFADIQAQPIIYTGVAAKTLEEYRVDVVKTGSDPKTFTAGFDKNSYARCWNHGVYIGMTTVNDTETNRKYSVVTYSGGGAITFYDKDDTGGTAENRGVLRLAAPISESYLDIGRTSVYPSHHNKASLGKANKLWTNIYASSGVINTSDKRYKQDIGAIPDEVIEAWRNVNWCQYRWREAVAEKSVGARYHLGLIAQSIKEAFEKHGLDAQDYGLLCYDQWAAVEAQDAVLDDNGNVIQPATEYQPAGERWGVRMDECLAMEAESNRRLIKALQAEIKDIKKMIKKS